MLSFTEAQPDFKRICSHCTCASWCFASRHFSPSNSPLLLPQSQGKSRINQLIDMCSLNPLLVHDGIVLQQDRQHFNGWVEAEPLCALPALGAGNADAGLSKAADKVSKRCRENLELIMGMDGRERKGDIPQSASSCRNA